jgi:hypothetical protein
MDTASIGEYSSDDTCIYTVYRNIYFWKPGKIMLFPILITLIILLLIALITLLVWLLKKLVISKMQRELDSYKKLGGSTGTTKHKVLVEEEVPDSNNNN